MSKLVTEKLLIKPNTMLWLSHTDRIELLGPLPEGVMQAGGLEHAATGIVFADSAAALREILTLHRESLAQPSNFWVLYPKANRADINRDSLWPILAEYGLRPITQIAIDDVWSALRFRPLKPGEAPFTGG